MVFLIIIGVVMLLCAVVLFFCSDDPSVQNPRAAAIAMAIFAILFIILGIVFKSDRSNSKGGSDSDYWKCPSCGYYVKEDYSFCPKCVREGLGID